MKQSHKAMPTCIKFSSVAIESILITTQNLQPIRNYLLKVNNRNIKNKYSVRKNIYVCLFSVHTISLSHQ